MYICRECENEINQGTEICPHCGVDLTVAAAGNGVPAAIRTTRKTLLRWVVLLSVLLGAIWGFLWFVVPERQGDPTAQAEARAIEALREVRVALRDYAASQNGTFPRQLDALGEPVRNAAQLAQSVSYQLQYTPGQVESDGLIRTYSLQARAGNFGFRNFYTDEGGSMRATRENRAATAEDAPY